MPTYEQYWMGYTPASVTSRQCDSAFVRARRPRVENSTATLRFMNEAFGLYYRTIHKALTWRDTDRADATIASVKDSATDGSGRGVSDLREAFEHLVRNADAWTDSAFAVYEGASSNADQYKCFRGRYVAPVALVNFITSVDEKRELLFESAGEFSTLMNRASRAISGNAHWSDLSDLADFVSEWSENVGHLLWATNELRTSNTAVGRRLDRALGRVGAALEPIGEHVGRIGGVASLVSTVAGALNTMVAMERLPVPGAAGYAAAFTAAKVACGFLPILGDVYCEAIDAVPNIANNFKRLITERCNTLDALVGEYSTPTRGFAPVGAGAGRRN